MGEELDRAALLRYRAVSTFFASTTRCVLFYSLCTVVEEDRVLRNTLDASSVAHWVFSRRVADFSRLCSRFFFRRLVIRTQQKAEAVLELLKEDASLRSLVKTVRERVFLPFLLSSKLNSLSPRQNSAPGQSTQATASQPRPELPCFNSSPTARRNRSRRLRLRRRGKRRRGGSSRRARGSLLPVNQSTSSPPARLQDSTNPPVSRSIPLQR